MTTHPQTQTTIFSCISNISIEYKNGFFEVLEFATAISKHESLQEAQWVRSVLETQN